MEETEEETAALMEEKQQQQPFEIERQIRENDDVGSRKNLRERSWNESKKIWEIAAPVILASGSEFSITFVTAAFVGHLGEIEFAAVSVVQNVIEGFVYGVMVSTNVISSTKKNSGTNDIYVQYRYELCNVERKTAYRSSS